MSIYFSSRFKKNTSNYSNNILAIFHISSSTINKPDGVVDKNLH